MSNDLKRVSYVGIFFGILFILIGALTGSLEFSTRSSFETIKYDKFEKATKKVTVTYGGKSQELILPNFNYLNEKDQKVTISVNPKDKTDYGYYVEYDESGPVGRIFLIVLGAVMLLAGGFYLARNGYKIN